MQLKSYTDLEQSKKLEKILPIESADMYFEKGIGDNYKVSFGNYADMQIYLLDNKVLFI